METTLQPIPWRSPIEITQDEYGFYHLPDLPVSTSDPVDWGGMLAINLVEAYRMISLLTTELADLRHKIALMEADE